MSYRNILYGLTLVMFVLCSSVSAELRQDTQQQTANVSTSQNRLVGEVTAIDPGRGQLELKTTEGQSIVVQVDDKTLYRRVPPGETTLVKATVISLADIGVGDKVIARGDRKKDQPTLHAGALIVVSKTEIAKKRERDRAEWLQRGISGVITAINPASPEITVLTHGPQGTRSIVLTGGPDVRFRRYAPDSVRFVDAKAGTFAELKVGDQLRAVGTKDADGTRFIAEEIVSGSFRTISGVIASVNSAHTEIQVNDVQSRQPVTIIVTGDSMLRSLTPEVIDLIKRSVTSGPSASSKPQESSSSGDIQNKIEQLPVLNPADLKVGDSLLVASTSGSDAGRVTAIIIANGAENLLRWQAQQSTARIFTFGLGLPSGVPID
jgi:hypothetical protein